MLLKRREDVYFFVRRGMRLSEPSKVDIRVRMGGLLKGPQFFPAGSTPFDVAKKVGFAETVREFQVGKVQVVSGVGFIAAGLHVRLAGVHSVCSGGTQ